MARNLVDQPAEHTLGAMRPRRHQRGDDAERAHRDEDDPERAAWPGERNGELLAIHRP
jgi:hypothetical protein